MAKAKAKVVAKIKKKFWCPLIAPKVFNNEKLGEIYLTEASQAVGRTFWYGLKELSENMRDQNVYLNFKIKNAAGNNLNTDLVGYKLTPTSIKKMVRRNYDRSDDSFVVETSDNRKVRLKTLILTAYQTKHSNSTRLKKIMIKRLTEDIKKINFGNLLDKLVSHRLQMETKKFLTKIYPVKVFEVKYMGLEKERIPGKEGEAAEEISEEVKEEIAETPAEETKTEEAAEEKPKKPKKKEIEEAVEEAEEKAAEKAVEKAAEEEMPKEQAEKAAEEVAEEKEE